MAGAVLSPADRAYLKRCLRQQMNSTVARRMNVLLLLDDGWSAERIAEALYLDAKSVRDYRDLYAASGVRGLERLGYSPPAAALDDCQREALVEELTARLYMTAKTVCRFVAERFAVEYTPNAMTKLLKRLGFVYKKPKCVPAKADAATQQQFFEQTLAPLMAAAGPEQPLYFVDGTHPAYTGHPAYGWIKRGTTKQLKSNHGRVNVNINGALSWPDLAVVQHFPEKITSAAMVALFDDLQTRHPGAPLIRVAVDNASYNRSAAIKAYLARDGCRIRLIYLPPYAPNLNLIERLWWFFKKKTLWNAHYPTLAEFQAAIRNFFDNIGQYADELRRLLTGKFRFIGA